MRKKIPQLITLTLAFPRWAKRALVFTLDINLCLIATWLAFYLRLGEFISFAGLSRWSSGATTAAAASIGIALPIFVIFRFYRSIFRYSGWLSSLTLARTLSVYGLVYAMIFTLLSVENVPRTVGIIQPVLLFLLISLSRYLAQAILGKHYLFFSKQTSRTNALIYGTGRSGRQLKSALDNNSPIQVVGFLDDDDLLHDQVLDGCLIYNPAELQNIIHSQKVSEVLFAMPNLSRKRRNEILKQLTFSHVRVRSVPNISELAQGAYDSSKLMELDVYDLLAREPVMPSHILMAKCVYKKVVMVTGAGGSIGSEICRQLLSNEPTKLLLIENSEIALYSILSDLEKIIVSTKSGHIPELVPFLTSVQDKEQIQEIISTWVPDTIYHSAAFKHVSLVEQSVVSSIKNNVLGTLIMAEAAIDNGVQHFVLISSDKAVRPTSVMGATKRLAEMVLQALASKSHTTILSIVRFGNVLDSSGSVVPKFRQQISKGGPITVTHPDVNRYFMTISEASQLVIQAGALARCGDLFMLDMGQPVKIIDLARRMVELSGLRIKDKHCPEGDIEIEFTGLQPGEKLFEELLIVENSNPTNHPQIKQGFDKFPSWLEIMPRMNELTIALKENDVRSCLLILQHLVEGYMPSIHFDELLSTKKTNIHTTDKKG